MTVPSARAHANAVLALLTTPTVYDGEVPTDPVLPYAVAYINNGTTARHRLTTVSGRLDVSVQITSVGETREQAQLVADWARGDLLDARPVVAGRQCTALVHEASQPVRRDDDVTPPRMYAVDLFTFSSDPA